MSNYEHTVTNLAAEQGAKLVRDKIPAIILAEDGRTARVEVLDDAAYEQALCKKAIEEATEFATADTDSQYLRKLPMCWRSFMPDLVCADFRLMT